MRPCECNVFTKGERGGKFSFRFTGEPYHNIRCDGGVFKCIPQVLDDSPVFIRRVVPVHPGQGFIASALQGKMKLRAELCLL